MKITLSDLSPWMNENYEVNLVVSCKRLLFYSIILRLPTRPNHYLQEKENNTNDIVLREIAL